ncbi:hypothetical protein Sp14A_06010 [Streptococcus pluranimalium]|uniref:Uncharacterized protein n=1 Tax=Streptococcus pluranimalium TaxID=82348 RepID=A0A345VIH9_9STRE|nr:hypothetical protein Sp14A_05610 [Streptococcus pluranimalium]AXJ12531.1 hypothetical protein Sp14A_06010 [Streptococcus pluranimalium]
MKVIKRRGIFWRGGSDNSQIQSQMNNGHTVVVGDNMLNPRYIEIIDFEEVVVDGYE